MARPTKVFRAVRAAIEYRKAPRTESVPYQLQAHWPQLSLRREFCLSSSGNFNCRPSVALRTQIRRESELLLRT
jgi:hypothetical protein